MCGYVAADPLSLSLSLTFLRNIVHIDKKFTAVQRTVYELEYSIVLNTCIGPSRNILILIF